MGELKVLVYGGIVGKKDEWGVKSIGIWRNSGKEWMSGGVKSIGIWRNSGKDG